MSNQNGNEQALAYSHPENAKNAMQQQKKKPLTAFVQIGLAEQVYGPVKVELSQNCSTVAEHATFLLNKINESRGSVIDFQLECPVELASVLKEDTFLMDHNVPFDVDCKYIFKFKLANGVVYGQVEERGLAGQVEELSEQMAQLAKDKEELNKHMEEQAGKVEHLADNMAQLEEEQAKQLRQIEQLEKWKEEQEKEKMEKRQKQLEEEEAKAKLEEEQRMASAEYASLIGVPNVANLQAHYNKEKLLQLIQHGAMPSIYIQSYQELNDPGLLQSIVNLLATAEKPAQMVGEVTIEYDHYWPTAFTQPKSEELKLLRETPNSTTNFNKATTSPVTSSSHTLAEYELNNRGIRFQVLLHYWEDEDPTNKSVYKFLYRRLP